MRTGIATSFSGRYNGDGHAVYRCNDTGAYGWAVSDGCTDSHISHCIASVTAQVAAEQAATTGVRDAVSAAAEENHAHMAGNACLLVVRADPASVGWELAWVGHCRAYELTDDTLVQLTEDHAVPAASLTSEELAQQFDQYMIPRLRVVPTASLLNHKQPSMLRTATPRRRLILVTDGVYTALADHEIANILERHPDPDVCARQLANHAAAARDVPDSGTAIVVNPNW